MRKERFDYPLSETLGIGICLAFVGGFLDVYTYILRGGVFANAQTGNMALLAIYGMRGDFVKAAYYIVPIAAYAFGVLITEYLKRKFTDKQWMYWEHVVIGIEALLLFVIGFMTIEIPHSVVNVSISLICSMQANSFRKTKGLPYATTMCTGNLRSASEHLFKFMTGEGRQQLYNSLRYFLIIFGFCIGAFIGTYLTDLWKEKAVWVCCAILAGVIVVMIFDKVRPSAQEC